MMNYMDGLIKQVLISSQNIKTLKVYSREYFFSFREEQIRYSMETIGIFDMSILF